MSPQPLNPRSVFGRAIELESATERKAYLDEACAGEPHIRERVEALLRAHDAAGGFLQPVAVEPDQTGTFAPAPESTQTIGPYKLLEKIGEGGMGEVWVADQIEPIKRRVAIKLIKPGMDSSGVLARFEAERQALAVMDHPNIARVLDAGTTPDGRPYFVMELVKGTPITEFCDVRKLSPKERLELFVPVCQAIQHAHMKGIIHRDIKPSNVLVELYDDRAVAKVIDFGVAKAIGQRLTEKTIYTAFGALVGTPTYMAPEQATFNALDIDTRADVYALGVLLYELLAGSPPIEKDRLKKAALDEVLRIVRHEEPVRPSQRLSTSQARASIAATRGSEPAKLSQLMKGELDWIVMKALEKDRARRYESANSFAADVQRYLSGEQVQAVPPSLGYRLRKAYRRNRGPVIAASLVLVVLLAGVIGTSIGLFKAYRARQGEVDQRNLAEGRRLSALAERDEKIKALAAEQLAREGEKSAREQVTAALALERQAAYDLTIPLIQKAIQENDFARASALLASCPEDLRHWEWHYLNRNFDRGAMTLRPGYSEVRFDRAVDQFTADGKALIRCSEATVRVRDVATGETTRLWDFAANPVPLGNFAQLSADRRLIAVWFQRKRVGFPIEDLDGPDGPDVAGKPFEVTLVSIETGKPVSRLAGLPDRVRAVLFNADSSRVATTGANNEVRVWDAAGKLLRTLKCDGASKAMPVAFTPDGKSLITNSATGMVKVLSSNGAFVDGEGTFRVWDLGTGVANVSGSLAPYADWTTRFAKTVRLPPPTREPFARISPDGRYAVGLASDVYRFVVDLKSGKEIFQLSGDFTGLGFLPNSSLLAVSPDGVCTAFELPGGKAVRSYPIPNAVPKPGADEFESFVGRKPQLTTDGRWLTRYDAADGVVEVREAESGRVVRTVPTGRVRSVLRAPSTVFDPFGKRMLTSAANGEQKLWDLSTDTSAKLLHLATESIATPRVLATSPDGRTVAVLMENPSANKEKPGARRARLELMDLRSGTSRVLAEGLANGTNGNAQAVFSSDGRKVVAMVEATFTGLSQFHPHVWDVETGTLLVRSQVIGVSTNARAYDLGLPQIALSSEGVPLVARIATNKDVPGRKAWLISEVVAEKADVRTARVTIPVGQESAIRLSADGRLAAVFGRSFDMPDIQMWDCETQQVLWSLPTQPGRIGKFDGLFSADGSRFLVTDLPERGLSFGQPTPAAPQVIVRDTRSGRVIAELRLPAGADIHGLSMSPDGRRVYSTNTGGQTRSVIFNADTGRELIANFDNSAWLDVGSRMAQRLFQTPDGNLIAAQKRAAVGAKDAASLLVWDGRKSMQPAKPSVTVDDMLAEAFRLTEDPSPTKRSPSRALELTTRAREFYPTVPEIDSPHALALLRSKRFAEASEMLLGCVIREEAVEGRVAFKKLDDGSKAKSQATVARKATDYFLLALATAGSGETEKAKVWFRWGESRLLSPYTWGERRSSPMPGEVSAETERARAEPFRQEAARALGLAAEPITQADLRKLNHDPADPINRIEWMLGRLRGGEKNAEDEKTAIWAAEFLVANSRPIPELFYNAACVYSLFSGKATSRKDQYAQRAMELLQRVSSLGRFRQPEVAKTDEDLNPLRGRVDFKKWLADLEKSASPMPEPGPAPKVKK